MKNYYTYYAFFIIILLNITSSYYFIRIDLTNEKKYSLSKETKDLLNKLDDLIYFKVYLHGDLPIQYIKLKNELQYILDEFRVYSNNIEYDFISPSAIKNEQYRLSLQQELYEKGIIPIPHRNYDNTKMEEFLIFPGIISSYRAKENSIYLINESPKKNPELVIQESIDQLEYLLTNSIRNLTRQKKKKIGLINGHGESTKKSITSFQKMISEHYQLINITINEQLLALKGLDCIIINDPQNYFTEKDKFIIDQFIMNGGKSLWILDGTNANIDSLITQSETIALPIENRNLEDMLFKYGVRVNTDLTQDLQSAPVPIVTHYIDEQPQWDFFPWIFFPVLNPLSHHLINHNTDPVKTEFPSSIDTINNTTKKTILLQTSSYTKLNQTPALINLESLRKKPNQKDFTNKKANIAVLLDGQFESLYKNRIPPIITDNPDIKFKTYIKNNKMIIISDGDFLKNQFYQNQALPLGFDKHTGTQYGNNDFIVNAIDFLLDNQNFIKIRSKNIEIRSLNKVKKETEKTKWKIINSIIPLALIFVLGLIILMLRNRKYHKK